MKVQFSVLRCDSAERGVGFVHKRAESLVIAGVAVVLKIYGDGDHTVYKLGGFQLLQHFVPESFILATPRIYVP